ncbi:GNAT family N-acetyltransferase [Patescibacteria group bacterium]|nr:GNAT family N-acetyltransferase [Patescibacteria group bacterium]
MNNLIPKNFQVPAVLETDKFRLRMLTVNDVVKDYDAVMTSVKHLQETNPFGPKSNWPTKELTFEQDLIDLGWHQKEFQNRSSFAYTVMSLDEKNCLGCMYIYPSSNSKYDAKIIAWVRQSVLDLGFDELLFNTVKQWIKDKWLFKNPGYPGREISWKDWQKL